MDRALVRGFCPRTRKCGGSAPLRTSVLFATLCGAEPRRPMVGGQNPPTREGAEPPGRLNSPNELGKDSGDQWPTLSCPLLLLVFPNSLVPSLPRKRAS